MKHNKERKVMPVNFLVALLILTGVYIAGSGVAIYAFGSSDPVSGAAARILPYPAAVVESFHFVTLRELGKDLQSVRRFYENQDFSESGARVDFSTSDGHKRLMVKKRNLLNKMIENKVIEIIARNQGVTVGADLVSQEVERKMKEYGSREEVKEKLSRLYGWDLSDFEEKIVKPQMYKERLEQYMQENNIDTARAKNKIEQALVDLEKKGDFSAVAEKYSEGESAKNGGELGWFSADQMIPPVAVAAFSLEKESRSGIVESVLGYHIVQLEDKKTEDGVERVKVKQIIVRTESFSDWLLRKEKEIPVYIPLKDFYWNRETGTVEFHDSALREFSDNLDQNSQGDISVSF